MNRTPSNTQGVVLTRTNFGEADRIVTFLTRDFGKVSVIAKGVRKEKSKLAGGIELFSVSDIGFVAGRGELATLTSSRLITHYGGFLHDLAKVDFVYGALKVIHKFTTDDAGPEYFILVQQLFTALNEPRLGLDAASVWWYVQLSNVTGHALNLESTTDGEPFTDGQTYIFDGEHAGFTVNDTGNLTPNHIKFMRLALLHGPLVLANVQGGNVLGADLAPYLKTFVEYQF